MNSCTEDVVCSDQVDDSGRTFDSVKDILESYDDGLIEFYRACIPEYNKALVSGLDKFPMDHPLIFDKPKFFHSLGMFLEKCELISSAGEAYSYAVEMNPEEPDYLLSLSKICLKRGRVEEAFKHARMGLEIDGDNTDLRHHLGVLNKQPYELRKAESYFPR